MEKRPNVPKRNADCCYSIYTNENVTYSILKQYEDKGRPADSILYQKICSIDSRFSRGVQSVTFASSLIS